MPFLLPLPRLCSCLPQKYKGEREGQADATIALVNHAKKSICSHRKTSHFTRTHTTYTRNREEGTFPRAERAKNTQTDKQLLEQTKVQNLDNRSASDRSCFSFELENSSQPTSPSKKMTAICYDDDDDEDEEGAIIANATHCHQTLTVCVRERERERTEPKYIWIAITRPKKRKEKVR